MNWREMLKVNSSNFEALMHGECLKLDLYPDTNHSIQFTTPDQYYPDVGKRGLAVYFDGWVVGKTGKGKLHASYKGQEWDELVNKVLQHLGVIVLRFPFKPPGTKGEARKFAETIKETVERNKR